MGPKFTVAHMDLDSLHFRGDIAGRLKIGVSSSMIIGPPSVYARTIVAIVRAPLKYAHLWSSATVRIKTEQQVLLCYNAGVLMTSYQCSLCYQLTRELTKGEYQAGLK